VRSHLWMSALAPLGGRSLRVSGTHAGIETPGLDPQEDQLAAGLRPGDAGWGEGEPARVVDRTGEERRMVLRPGAYERYYAAVRDALHGDAAMPVDPRESVAALHVIDAARRSAASATVIDTAGG
jgi:scyllo-inositol 2-dehydrogenase (NADP+)